jgi:Bacterial TSP3 repeat
MKKSILPLLCASALTAIPGSSFAGTITFAEFDGLGNDAPLPSPPQGLPPGITATWTGFALHTTAGDTPMSVFPTDNRAGADDATIVFSAPVWITSINVYDTDWGTDPVIVTGRLKGTNVWVYTSPGNQPWTKVTDGAGKAIDTLAFEGRWNHYDDIVVDAVFADTDGDGLNDFWEYSFFPGDLTKLTATGDFDHDGLTDVQEYNKGTDPTKTDTDGDGLTDSVETGTGFYISPTDTGTDPLKPDTDNDGRLDGDEVKGTPQTNPTLADSDYDGYLDGDEVATGHDPNNAGDNPEMTAIANSFTGFSGVQGQNNWYSGYRNYTADGGGINYNPDSGFIPFPGGSDNPNAWDGVTQCWRNGGWDLNASGSGPWTMLGQENTHPNGANSGGQVHWTIRRWVAAGLTQVTPLAFRWHAHKQSATCIGNGVTSGLYINGQLKDSAVIPGGDTTGITHTYYANVAPGDKVDLILSPRGADAQDNDGCDGTVNRLLADPTIPAVAHQPDGSLFVPVGAGDTDGDGLPDIWERNYFPNDLTKLTATGDYDHDGLSDLLEYQRHTDPTKADTDGDGLSDLVETGTGVYVSRTDTGSNPTVADSDGDGLSDFVEVNRNPPTNPNKADTDNDGWSDPDEIAWGTDPTNPQDTPVAFLIANSQAQFSGVQGSNGWYSGYRVYNPVSGSVDYDANQDFIRFPGGEGQGSWDGVAQTWNNGSWALNTAAAGPWTMLGPLAVHPNGTNSPPTIGGTEDPTNEQWTTRRWVAGTLTSNTPVTIIWQVRKTNLNNDGVTGLLFINGKLADSKAIEGTDGNGEVRRYRVILKPNDIVDLALSPAAPNGDRFDYSDGSETWFWIDTRPWPPADIVLSGSNANLTQGKFTFSWNSSPGVNYVVSYSSNMKDWTALPAVPSGGTTTTFTDNLGSPTPAARFYRVSPQ